MPKIKVGDIKDSILKVDSIFMRESMISCIGDEENYTYISHIKKYIGNIQYTAKYFFKKIEDQDSFLHRMHIAIYDLIASDLRNIFCFVVLLYTDSDKKIYHEVLFINDNGLCGRCCSRRGKLSNLEITLSNSDDYMKIDMSKHVNIYIRKDIADCNIIEHESVFRVENSEKHIACTITPMYNYHTQDKEKKVVRDHLQNLCKSYTIA